MVDSECGYQLYLNIVRVDLATGSDSSSAPNTFAKIYVDSKKRDLETKRNNDDFTPTYNQEFVLNVAKANSLLSIKIKEHHRVGRNKTIGTADISLSDLQVGNTEEIVANLSNGGSVVVVLCMNKNPQIGTQSSGHELHVRLPALRVVLERDEYFPGEVIRGFVRYHEKHKTSISAVRLCFEGISHAQLTIRTGQSYYTHHSRATLLRHTTVLFGSQDYKTKTEVGPNFFFEKAFEFRLPDALAASWHVGGNPSTTNRYRVIAFVDRHKVRDKKAKVEFIVRSSLSHARLDTATAICQQEIHDGKLELQLSAQQTFFAGKPYPVTIVIDNTKGTKTVESVKLAIKGKYFYYVGCGGRHHHKWTIWHRTFEVASSTDSSNCEHALLQDELDLIPVPPGERREAVVRILIPKKHVASLHAALSPIVQSVYYVSAKAKTDGGHFKTHKLNCLLPVLSMVENRFTDSPSEASALQCLAYTMPSPLTSSSFLVPLNSPDGKKLIDGMSARYAKFGNFGDFGHPIEHEHYLTRDSKFQSNKHGSIDKTGWRAGLIPGWAPKEGLDFANIPNSNAPTRSPRTPANEPRMDQTQKLEESSD